MSADRTSIAGKSMAANGTKPRRAKRAERGSISAEQIVGGAMDLVKAIGLDALSMPKLAEHLGIGVTSIYWYFRNKDDLLEAMTVVAARRFHAQMVSEDGPWDAMMFERFCRLRAAMREDEVSCDLLFMRGGRASEAALSHMWPDTEMSLARMTDAGFSPHEALQNIVILSLYTRGSVVLERQMRRNGIAPDMPTPVPASFPTFGRALASQNTRGVSDEAYREQIRAIIDGMALRLRHRGG